MSPAARTRLGWLGGQVLRTWIRSLRVEVTGTGLASEVERPWVLAFWHGQQMPLFGWPRRPNRKTFALVSFSRDGDLQLGALSALGLAVERGSSSRGGASGLRAISRRLDEGHDAAFAIDGPRGPLHVARPGAIAAARHAGAALVPMGAAVDRFRLLERTWDRYLMPMPFARVVIALGPSLDPHATSTEDLGAAVQSAVTVAERTLADRMLARRTPAQSAPPHHPHLEENPTRTDRHALPDTARQT